MMGIDGVTAVLVYCFSCCFVGKIQTADDIVNHVIILWNQHVCSHGYLLTGWSPSALCHWANISELTGDKEREGGKMGESLR